MNTEVLFTIGNSAYCKLRMKNWKVSPRRLPLDTWRVVFLWNWAQTQTPVEFAVTCIAWWEVSQLTTLSILVALPAMLTTIFSTLESSIRYSLIVTFWQKSKQMQLNFWSLLISKINTSWLWIGDICTPMSTMEVYSYSYTWRHHIRKLKYPCWTVTSI